MSEWMNESQWMRVNGNEKSKVNDSECEWEIEDWMWFHEKLCYEWEWMRMNEWARVF